MTYSNLPENEKIKKKVLENIRWIDDLSEIDMQIGIYFFKEAETGEIVYIGQGGTVKQNLKKRVKQYFMPSDSGTIAFKHKVLSYPLGTSKAEKKDYYKKNYQKTWRKYMTDRFEIGILEIKEMTKHDVEIEEAYLIGLFRTKFNY